MKAVDLDEVGSPSANVTYELYPASTTVPFTIDELSGDLTVQGQYNNQTDYNFLARACDNPVQDSDRYINEENLLMATIHSFTCFLFPI